MRLNNSGMHSAHPIMGKRPIPQAQFGARYATASKGELAMGGASIVTGLATTGITLGAGLQAGAFSYASSGLLPVSVGGSTILETLRTEKQRNALKNSAQTKIELPEDRMKPLQAKIDAEQAVQEQLGKQADLAITANKDKKFGPFTFPQLVSELFTKNVYVGYNVLEERLMAIPTYKTQLESDLASIPQPKKIWNRLKTRRQKAEAQTKLLKSVTDGLKHLESEKLAVSVTNWLKQPQYLQLTEVGMTVLKKLQDEAAAAGKATATQTPSPRDVRQGNTSKIREKAPTVSIYTPTDRMKALQVSMEWQKTADARLNKSADLLLEKNKDKQFGPFTFPQLMNVLFEKNHTVIQEFLEERLLEVPAYKTLLEQKLAELPKPTTTWQKYKAKGQQAEVKNKVFQSVLAGVKHLEREIITIAQSDMRHNLNSSQLTELGATVLKNLQAQAATQQAEKVTEKTAQKAVEPALEKPLEKTAETPQKETNPPT